MFKLEKPELYPEYLVDGKPVHPPLYVSGLRLRLGTDINLNAANSAWLSLDSS